MRSQSVQISIHKSEWKLLEEGMPWGSINEFDYFNIFLNDLFYCLNGLYNIDNDANDDILSEKDKYINAIVDKPEVLSCETVTWFDQNCMQATLREKSSQTNVFLQYKLLASILSAVCSVIQQS